MDELQISGKRFISSRRLAREHGYTADYLGQLIRGGKVTGQKVGRAWYVDAASFDAYLGTETPNVSPQELAQQRSSDLLAQQSSQDAGEARPFVAQAPAPIAVEVAPAVEPAPVFAVEEKKEEEPAYHVPLHILKADALVGSPTDERRGKEESGLRYYADNEPSLPEIRLKQSESRIEREVMGEKEVFAAPHARRPAKFAVAAFGGVALAVFVFSAVLSSALSLNLSIEAGNTASTWYSLQW